MGSLREEEVLQRVKEEDIAHAIFGKINYN
jgi:hypothetical protein